MGTGKTSVGKILARKLGRELLDVDFCIEQKEKRKIREVFEKEGEAYFRNIEKQTIAEVAQKKGVVITTGGGAVIDSENIEALRKNGWIVALKAQPGTILGRVKDSRHRPLLKADDKFSQIERLLEARKPFYGNCDFSFETDNLTPLQVADKILETMGTLLNA